MSERALQGIVSQVSYKDFTDNRSGEPIKLYSFQIEGSNQWFRTGRQPIPAGVRDSIKFVADGQNVNVGSVARTQAQVAAAPSPVAPATGSSRSPSTTGRTTTVSKDEYWANKEARDLDKEARFQAVNEPRMALSVATEAASRIVSAAFQTDALGFGNASKAKKLGMIVDATKEVAAELALFITNAPSVLAEHRVSDNDNKKEETDTSNE